VSLEELQGAYHPYAPTKQILPRARSDRYYDL
jgi:hypothetical protein